MIAQVVPITRLRRDTATWSYLVPPRTRLWPGALVSVPLQGRECLGIVWELSEDDEKATRGITRILCARPLVRTPQRQLVEYLSQYGLCSLSTALYVWLPRALRKNLGRSAATLIESYAAETERADSPAQHCILVPGRRPEQESLVRRKFGAGFASLFAETSETQELEAWLAINRGETRVGMGREGALFAPWRNLRNLTVIEPEDVFYYHEQIPYLNLAEAARALARFTGAQLQLRSHVLTPAAQALWPEAGGQDTVPPIRLIDLHIEELLNDQLLQAIRETLKRKQRVLILYNARDRDRLVKKDGLESIVKIPGIETLGKQLARRLGLSELPGSIALGTRAMLSHQHTAIGLTCVLSLDPLLETPLFANQVHGWGDLGTLFSYDAPCIIQAYDQANPLLVALRNQTGGKFMEETVKERSQNGLPPFGQHIVLSVPENKLDPESVEAIYQELAPLARPPWTLSHPFASSWHGRAYRTVMMSAASAEERLPTALRKAIISLPRPWKIQHNPWYVI